ncbi:MAG: uracil-DNA glycosylase family protein [Phycisphaerales bacterium JB043]
MDAKSAIRSARQDVITGMLLGDPYAALSGEAPEALAESDGGDKAGALEALRREHADECPHCTSVTGWTNIVFGEGDSNARLMFVGEAPGAEEDKQGRPFVGRSGKLLDSMIGAMGLSRESVYIANVLKTRPPNNRTPTPEEASLCGAYLRRQIGLIEPEVLVTLGRPAVQLLLETRESMSRLRGHWYEYEGTPLMPTFHPAYLLRQYTKENRARVWSDLQQAMDRLGLR